MNDKMLDYLMSKRDSRRNDRRDSRDYEDRRGKGTVDFEGSMDFRRDGNDYRNDYRYDSRDSRGGSDSRDSRDYRDYRDYEDSRDYRSSRDSRDMRDSRRAPKLSKTDIHHWKQMMENEDGSRGPHYDMQQIIQAAEKSNVRFEDFDEKEFCMAVNMMYSDYCKVAKKYVAPDKELAFFADLAKAFLEDEDGPEASEKLALYFHCIVDA